MYLRFWKCHCLKAVAFKQFLITGITPEALKDTGAWASAVEILM